MLLLVVLWWAGCDAGSDPRTGDASCSEVPTLAGAADTVRVRVSENVVVALDDLELPAGLSFSLLSNEAPVELRLDGERSEYLRLNAVSSGEGQVKLSAARACGERAERVLLVQVIAEEAVCGGALTASAAAPVSVLPGGTAATLDLWGHEGSLFQGPTRTTPTFTWEWEGPGPASVSLRYPEDSVLADVRGVAAGSSVLRLYALDACFNEAELWVPVEVTAAEPWCHPVPEGYVDYFPIEVGNRWTYAREGSTSVAYEAEITAVDACQNGERIVDVNSVNSEGSADLGWVASGAEVRAPMLQAHDPIPRFFPPDTPDEVTRSWWYGPETITITFRRGVGVVRKRVTTCCGSPPSDKTWVLLSGPTF